MKKLNNVIKIIAIPYFIIEVLANFDGAISFLNRLGVHKQVDTMIETAKILSSLIHFLLPLGFLYLLYKHLQTIEKLKALKKFRDTEAIFRTDRFNESLSELSESKWISNDYDNKNDSIYQFYSKASLYSLMALL